MLKNIIEQIILKCTQLDPSNRYQNCAKLLYDLDHYDELDNSYRRGRDQRTGRYVSRDRGYSRAMDKQRMIGKLQDMMDDATSDQDKRTLQQCVDKLERR